MFYKDSHTNNPKYNANYKCTFFVISHLLNLSIVVEPIAAMQTDITAVTMLSESATPLIALSNNVTHKKNALNKAITRFVDIEPRSSDKRFAIHFI